MLYVNYPYSGETQINLLYDGPNGIEQLPITKEVTQTDIDTIKTLDMPIDDFYKKFSGFLESMHTASKKQFFALLSNKGLESLEPIYDWI